MTDKEIIKALGCCISDENCESCPLHHEKIENACILTVVEFYKEILALINRLKGDAIHYRRKAQNQKQELRRLNKVIEVYGEENDKLKTAFVQVVMDREYAKAEAIKEFAERLKKEFPIEPMGYSGIGSMYSADGIRSNINYLVKEMVGEDE